jgi:hypothetical protein
MWETFKRKMRSSPKDPTVTLSTTGSLGLNTAVVRNVLGEAKYAHLLFDRDKRLIGIKFIKQSDADAYPVQVTKSKSHGSIAGVAFMKTYKIFPTETTSYSASFDDQSKMLIVDISGGTEKEAKKKGKA